MKCFLCKGELREQLTNFMIDVDNCFIIVKNVPSQVCGQCGEVSYTDEVAQKLECPPSRIDGQKETRYNGKEGRQRR